MLTEALFTLGMLKLTSRMMNEVDDNQYKKDETKSTEKLKVGQIKWM